MRPPVVLLAVLLVVVVSAACKHHSSAPVAAQRDAPAADVDWARCEQALHQVPALPENQRVAALLDGCPVCGDWSPLLRWNTPQDQGGPTRPQIEERLVACHAFCSSDAKQRFLGTLDDARGTGSRAPWRWLGDTCKAEVSAVPDTRYMSAPYFALDRIARAASAHSAEDAALVAKIDVPLPPVSISGGGVDLPPASAATDPPPAVHVTLLGDGAHVGKLPRARLGPHGVTVDYGGEPYPGPHVEPGALAHAIAALDPSPHPDVALLAPRGLAVPKVQEALAKAGEVTFHLAVDSPSTLPGWDLPAVLHTPLDLHGVSSGQTVEDLAKAK